MKYSNGSIGIGKVTKDRRFVDESSATFQAIPYESDYRCPITKELMGRPYKTNCGHTFELTSIQKHRETSRKPDKCPLCNQRVNYLELTPDYEKGKAILLAVKQLLEERKNIREEGLPS